MFPYIIKSMDHLIYPKELIIEYNDKLLDNFKKAADTETVTEGYNEVLKILTQEPCMFLKG